jgi:hypothetical protein
MVKKNKSIRLLAKMKEYLTSFDRHWKYMQAIHRIEVSIWIIFNCSICHQKREVEKIEYMRPRGDMWFNVTRCCHSLVCSKCAKSQVRKCCLVCSKETNVGSLSKRGPDWKKTYLKYEKWDEMLQKMPFLAAFASNRSLSWQDIVKIELSGLEGQKTSLRRDYATFLQNFFRAKMIFYLSRTLHCFPVRKTPASLRFFNDEMRSIPHKTQRKVFLKIAKGFVQNLAIKLSAEKIKDTEKMIDDSIGSSESNVSTLFGNRYLCFDTYKFHRFMWKMLLAKVLRGRLQ